MPILPPDSTEIFSRYRELVDDWSAFMEAVHAPLPQTIWTNTLRTTPEALASKLPIAPLSWYPGAFRFTQTVRPATLLPYLAGHYQIQEEAALLPIQLLQPHAGETVLDLCAAPGNKTVQMGTLMGSKGLVIANDRSRPRLDILRRSISRLGLTNIGVTVYDATSFRGAPASYDKILADVPCTGEGTIRRAKNKGRAIRDRRRDSLQNTQIAILKRAIKLCKPGGYVAYATCTFAPEENEAVVDAVLSHFDGKLAIVPCDTNGLQTTSGLTAWRGQSFHPDLRFAHRLWPHHNDTGGFFVAIIKKTAPTTRQEAQEKTPLASANKPEIAAVFQERFGLPAHTFDGYAVHPYGKFMSISNFDSVPADTPELVLAGMPFCKPLSKKQKLKTGAGIRWGSLATQNIIDLSESQAYAFGAVETIVLPERQITGKATHGYVLTRFNDMYLGLGFLRNNNGQRELESLLPKHWVHALNRL